MLKKFKSKKRKGKLKIKLMIFMFFLVFTYVFMIKFLNKNKLEKSILQDDFNYVKFNLNESIKNKISDIINSPINLLNSNVKKVEIVSSTNKSKNTNNDENNMTVISSYDEDNPIIYIYNTHQTESYADYNVYDASYSLKNNLNNYGLSSYLEEQSISAFLDTNGLKYYNSYVASRNYLDLATEKYSSLKYFFDIHRDSVSKEISTITYNGVNYAKVLFVVGTDNDNYQTNSQNANKLNEIIEQIVPNISRGLVYHGGDGFNGVYNQDISSEVFLIEVGAVNNTKEEVENTISVLSQAIKIYVEGAE